VLGAVLLLVAGASVSLAVGAWWLRAEVLDPDRWTATSALVVADPDVRADLSAELADRIVAAVRLEEVLGQTLPFPLGLLADPLAEGAAELVAAATEAGVATPAFAGVWESANRAAWSELLSALRDDGRLTSVVDGALTLDLERSLTLVRDELVDAGVPGIDALDFSGVDTRFVLVDEPELDRLRQLVQAIDVAVIVFPVVAIVLTGIGFVLLRRVGPGLVAVGAGMVLGAVTALAVASRARSVAVEAFSGGILGPVAAGRVVDAVVEGVRTPFLGVVVLGAVSLGVGTAVWVASGRRPSAAAPSSGLVP
jgi:hypothetical protein